MIVHVCIYTYIFMYCSPHYSGFGANDTDGRPRSELKEDIFSPKRGEVSSHKSNRKSSLRSTPSRDGEMSPAHDAVQKQLDAFADQLTVEEALTPVRHTSSWPL